MKILNKKGQGIGGIQVFIMGIVTIAVVLAIGLYVLQEVQTATLTDAGVATNASVAVGNVIDALADAPTWIGLLIIVVFASAVLAFFYMRGQ